MGVVVSKGKDNSQSSEAENAAIPIRRDKCVDSQQPSLVNTVPGQYRTKSIVVSNIGKDVSLDHLKNYLHSKSGIKKEQINLVLLLPAGRNMNDVRFLQYKVTIPDDNYESIMSSDFWPKNVHLRDFVYKHRKDTTVPKESFSFDG